ncbi:MAG: S41 family peptidase [Alphaproteobacteria bacterium]
MRRMVFVAVVAVALLAVPLVGQAASSETYRQLNLFGDVFERVRAEYVNEVSDGELIESAINGMLTSLDPHSSYLNAESFEEMKVHTKGEFGGLGIEVTMENGLVKVVSPIDDTPAFRAGIQPGDLITHLDGEPVLGLTLSDAVERMRGLVDTDIVLTVRRKGLDEPFDVKITRAIIKIQSVRSRIEANVAYLRITSFNEQTAPGLKREFQKLEQQLDDRIEGVILDLRNNPGGLLEQAVAVTDTFLDKGEIVSTRGRRADSIQRFNARPGDLAQGLPIVVLINGGSASASEIVAGALQDHRRAILLGTSSFGKGSVQTIIPLAGHGAMRLTTALYYTPSGHSIQAKGIEPDIVVEQVLPEPIDAASMQREVDLRNRLPGEEGEGADEGGPAVESPSGSVQDYQLARALDLLRGISLYREHPVN